MTSYSFSIRTSALPVIVWPEENPIPQFDRPIGNVEGVKWDGIFRRISCNCCAQATPKKSEQNKDQQKTTMFTVFNEKRKYSEWFSSMS